jgi:hypothetical protein
VWRLFLVGIRTLSFLIFWEIEEKKARYFLNIAQLFEFKANKVQ